jgi:hypothetical protein
MLIFSAVCFALALVLFSVELYMRRATRPKPLTVPVEEPQPAPCAPLISHVRRRSV